MELLSAVPKDISVNKPGSKFDASLGRQTHFNHDDLFVDVVLIIFVIYSFSPTT